MAVTIDGTNGINDTVLGSSTPAAANVTTLGASGEVTATGFTGTLDGILGSGTPAAANVTTLGASGEVTATGFTGTLDGVLGGGTPAAATVTTLAASGDLTANNFAGKNRIINGAMVIDQRNAGAAVSTAGNFAVDRWFMQRGGAAVFSLGQSTTVPAGFYNSIVATVTTAAALGSGEYYDIQQNIEGLNLLDLNWGTANAATVTLSFWVRSSVAGVYSFQFRNSASNRSIVYNYTIETVNTWQQITQTIAGDTSGTWLNTNGIGIGLIIPLGTGSNFTTATTGTWQAGNFNASTSALTTWQATLSNTFYITGVQLEKSSTATEFDHRSVGTELALCKRYYTTSDGDLYTGLLGFGLSSAAGAFRDAGYFPTSMRAAPTMAYTNLASGWSAFNINSTLTHYTVELSKTTADARPNYQFTASAEL